MSKPVVLLAERNLELRRQLFAQLLCQGYEVIDSPHTVDVLRTLRGRQGVDLFILSASLDQPGDGVELMQLLRHCERMPQVILTAERDAQEWASAAHAAGAAAYLPQPFSWQDVIASVHQLC
ncbi:MAG: response regulator [Deltaproteobacteria bacterium]|nr:response regulator [Deltaproteobacteria bacterium]